MKRTPLKRRTPMRNGKPLTAKTAPRRSRIRPVNPERKAAKDKRNFGAEADRVRAMPCLVSAKFDAMGWRVAQEGMVGLWGPGALCTGKVEASHVSARGCGGAKGDKTRLVPLCTAHHREAGEATRPGHDELLLDGEEARETKRQAFERRYGLSLIDEADRIALEHPSPLGLRGLADRFTAGGRPLFKLDDGSWRRYEEMVEAGGCEGCRMPLDDHELDALLGWVHREMGREHARLAWGDRHAAEFASAIGRHVDQVAGDRDLLAFIVAQTIGGQIADDPHGERSLARKLCEAAAQRFGGWPT